jgi:hypothetical protein
LEEALLLVAFIKLMLCFVGSSLVKNKRHWLLGQVFFFPVVALVSAVPGTRSFHFPFLSTQVMLCFELKRHPSLSDGTICSMTLAQLTTVGTAPLSVDPRKAVSAAISLLP